MDGFSIHSSFSSITFSVTQESQYSNCTVTIDSEELPCDHTRSLNLTADTPVLFSVGIFVVTDVPPLIRSYDFTAIQQPCSATAFDASASVLSECINQTSSFDASCLLISDSAVDVLKFDHVLGEFCLFPTVQVLNTNGSWENTSFENPVTQFGTSEFRLVYSTISNPPEILPLGFINITILGVDVTLELASFDQSAFDAQMLTNAVTVGCLQFTVNASISNNDAYRASLNGLGAMETFDSGMVNLVTLDVSNSLSLPNITYQLPVNFGL